MLTPAELLTELKRKGVFIEPKEGGKLVVQPADRLTDADREAIRALKPDLLRLLSGLCESAHIIARQCERTETDVAADLVEQVPDLINKRKRPLSPAESIVATCRHHGVVLAIDKATGDLMVGKAGARADEPSQPWPSLVRAIEAHLEPVAALVRLGWTLKAGFPTDRVAA